jgi:hypothetical protein
MSLKQRIDLAGRVFGRLTVLAFWGVTAKGEALWRCRCTCRRESVVYSAALRRGITRSCGCLRRDLLRQRNVAAREASHHAV